MDENLRARLAAVLGVTGVPPRESIAANTIRKAHKWTACVCDADRVRWDDRQPYIDHGPGCPLHALTDLEDPGTPEWPA